MTVIIILNTHKTLINVVDRYRSANRLCDNIKQLNACVGGDVLATVALVDAEVPEGGGGVVREGGQEKRRDKREDKREKGGQRRGAGGGPLLSTGCGELAAC